MLIQYLAAGAWDEAVELKINDMKEEKRISVGFLKFILPFKS